MQTKCVYMSINNLTSIYKITTLSTLSYARVGTQKIAISLLCINCRDRHQLNDDFINKISKVYIEITDPVNIIFQIHNIYV